jgi:hypothetical protein
MIPTTRRSYNAYTAFSAASWPASDAANSTTITKSGAAVMSLKDYSTEELEEELRLRELGIPRKVASPNFGRVEKLCDEFVTNLLQDTIHPDDNDFDHYVFEAAMEAVYGKGFWGWFRKRL